MSDGAEQADRPRRPPTGRRRARLPPTKLATTAAKMRIASRPSRNTMIAASTTTVAWLSRSGVSVGSTPSDCVVNQTQSSSRAAAAGHGRERISGDSVRSGIS